MPRQLFDSPFIFGIHEPGGERHMTDASKPGWIVFTEGIGSEANDKGGKDFSQWSNQNLGIICRLNNGYYPGGTIPHSSRYESFAKRCANYAAASKGCKIWIIGNEMNHPVERPNVQIDWSRTVRPSDPVSWGRYVSWRFNALDDSGSGGEPTRSRMAITNPGEVITPQLYARCYRLCRDAIHGMPGHADDQVLVGGVAPWNTLSPYDGNPSGDWIRYFEDILKLIGPGNCDGISIHAYTHSSNPDEIHTDTFMNAPFQKYQFNFRTYRDFMNAIPTNMRNLPVYCTETDQDVPWENRNNGWVQRAYGEIDHWNHQPGNQQIRALILYRWPNLDRWVIEGKQGVIEDFRQALGNNYRWLETPIPLPAANFKTGDTVYATQEVNVRESPGYQKDDIKAKAPKDTACKIVAGPTAADGLSWWQVRCKVAGADVDGWMADTTPTGTALLTKTAPAKPTPKPDPKPPVTGKFSKGEVVIGVQALNLRKSAGFAGKPASDVIYEIPVGSKVTILDGPQTADGLTWWGIRFVSPAGNRFDGWVAEATASGTQMLAKQGETPAPEPVPDPKPKPKPDPQPVPEPQPDPQPVPDPQPQPDPEPQPQPARPLKIGDVAVTSSAVTLRFSPGYQGKPASDAFYEAPAKAQLTLVEGPAQADNLRWWRVRYVSRYGNPFIGWAAETSASGESQYALPGQPAPQPEPQPVPQPQPQPDPQPQPEPQPQPAAFKKGDTVYATDTLILRKSAGNQGKPASDIIYEIASGSSLTILGGPTARDGLTWWNVRFVSPAGNRFDGWTAEAGNSGNALLTLQAPAPVPQPQPQPEPQPVPQPQPEPEPQPQPAAFKKGDTVHAADVINLRKSAGYQGKPASDIIYEIAAGSSLTILDGPTSKDGLTWWGVRFVSPSGNRFDGWAAEASGAGVALLTPGAPVPEPQPDPKPDPVPQPPASGKFQKDQHLYAATFLNLRRSPGYVNKEESDVVVEAPHGAELVVLGGPSDADSLTWWKVRYVDHEGRALDGWAAESNGSGKAYLLTSPPPTPQPTTPVPTKTFAIGNVVFNAFNDTVNIRSSAGFSDKPASDVVGKLAPGAVVTITAGPKTADKLSWWEVAGTVDGQTVRGWMAEIGTKGERFMVPVQFKDVIHLGKPFDGSWRVTQLMADREWFYKQFSYDGVPLRGHNGVDFGTPNGTDLLATFDGEVDTVGYEEKGFGNYVKLKHVWGDSIYGHMKSVSVKQGDTVAKGDKLGLSNNTGNSSGPHVHFGIRIYPNKRGDGWGGYCDPIPFMNPADVIIPDSIRSIGPTTPPPGMAPDEPGRERP